MKKKFILKSKTKKILIACLVITAISIIAVALIYPKVVELKARYQALDNTSDQINQMLLSKDYDIGKGLALFNDASIQVNELRDMVLPYYGFFRATGNLPWIGKYANQVEPILEYASQTMYAIQDMVDLFEPIMDSQIYNDRSSKLIQQINSHPELIVSAEDHLSKAENYYQSITLSILPEKISRKLVKLYQVHPLFKDSIKVLKLIPQITGAEKPITYLIMLQNSDELRPTGGFITSFGLLRIEQGKITHIEFVDSTQSNYISEVIEPPAPLKQILLAHYWLPRDANWSPDFQESAKQVQDLHFLSTGIRTDGVIALNQSSIQKILSFTGPVEVEGEIVSADTAIEYMISKRMEAISSGNPKNRKDFIALLAKAMFEKLPQKAGPDQLLKITKLFLDLASQGEFFMFSNLPGVQTLLEVYHLDGGLRPGSGDYLMVVDANLGYNKNDFVIKRSIEYSIDLRNLDEPKSKVMITYNNPLKGSVVCQQAGDISTEPHTGYIYPSCYWNYFRLLGPATSSITHSLLPDFVDDSFKYSIPWSHDLTLSTRKDGVTEAGGLLVLPPATSSSVTIERNLPRTVITKTNGSYSYNLTIQKQSGISELPVKVIIMLPVDAAVNNEKSIVTMGQNNGTWEWQSTLKDTLTEITITFN